MTKLNKSRQAIGCQQCTIYAGSEPADFMLIQPANGHDLTILDNEVATIEASTGKTANFCLAAIEITHWHDELSPWPAPPVFGSTPFGSGAQRTLTYITSTLMPHLAHRCATHAPVIIGGYSLAGLFALWCAYQEPAFAGAAAVSPSVWFPGWLDYAKAPRPTAHSVYLSLGDKEHHTKTAIMKNVDSCITMQHNLLCSAIGADRCTLEWNAGNHFQDNDIRTARAFSWLINSISSSK